MTRTARGDDAPRVALGYLRGLFEHLRQRGVPRDPVLVALGVTEEDLADPDLLVPDAAQNTAFAVAEALTGDSNVGLHAGRSMQAIDLGVVGHLAMACGRMQELFELLSRYVHLVGNGIRIEHETRADVTYLHMYACDEPHTRQVIDFNLAGWLSLARLLAGDEVRPLRIDLHVDAPADLAEHEAFFGCPLRYGQSAGRVDMELDGRLAARRLLHGDPVLHAALEAEARRRLNAIGGAPPASDARVAAVRSCAAQLLARGAPEVEDVAAEMGVSARTLQRELGRVGTTFRDVLDDLRKELAARYVRDVSLTLVDVALMLGFSDQTAFQRAFRRWFDVTPGVMRRASRA